METKPRRCRPRRLQDVPLPPPRVYAPPTTLKPLPRGGSDETTRGRCKWEWLHQRKSGRPTGRTTGQDEQRDGNPPGQDAQPFLSDSTLPRALTLFSKVSPQLSNLQLPRLFLVTDPICSLFCVQHTSVSIPYLQFKLETGVALQSKLPTVRFFLSPPPPPSPHPSRLQGLCADSPEEG